MSIFNSPKFRIGKTVPLRTLKELERAAKILKRGISVSGGSVERHRRHRHTGRERHSLLV